MARLVDKVVIVTGAALGLGAAIAKLAAREGAKVVLTDLKDQEGRSLADSLPDSMFIHHDVAIEDQWRMVIA